MQPETQPSPQPGTDSLLLVIDLQRDFCPGGALPVPCGDEVIAVLHRLAPHFPHIALTQDWHPPGHCSFASAWPGARPLDTVSTSHGPQRLWPDHCVQGTPGADIHTALHLPQAELILRKGFRLNIDSYSAFCENDRTTPTGLAGWCRERGLTDIYLAGLAFDYCVGYSALDARRAGFEATILRDVTRAIAPSSARAMEAELSQAGVRLLTSNEAVGSSCG